MFGDVHVLCSNDLSPDALPEGEGMKKWTEEGKGEGASFQIILWLAANFSSSPPCFSSVGLRNPTLCSIAVDFSANVVMVCFYLPCFYSSPICSD